MTHSQTEADRPDSAEYQPENQSGNPLPHDWAHSPDSDTDTESTPARFDTDDRALRAAGEMAGEETEVLEAVPGNQPDLPPSASPPAFSTMDATADVDAVIDRDGNDDDLEAVVGLNSPIRGDVGPPSNVTPPPPPEHRPPAPQPAETNEAGPQLPIADYDDLSVVQVSRKLPDLSEDELRQVEDYERSHRKRKTLLAKLERRLHNERPNRRSSGEAPSHEVGHADHSHA
jgi:hypothetical protein